MRSKFVLALAVGLLVGLMGLPASASVNDTGTLTGSARVGKTFLTANDCDKTGDAQVVGKGLYVVGSLEDMARENQGAWHIETTSIVSATIAGPLTLEACGWLGPLDGTRDYNNEDDRTDGVGPACGASKGHHGMGEIRRGPAKLMKLMHLGWKNAVGGLLPVTGSYQEYTNAAGTSKGKKGTVLAQIVAQGANRCLDPDGAQEFTVAGTYELINADTKDTVKPPKIQHKKCKEPDPDKDKTKDMDPAHPDADWKRPCPTAKK